MKRRHFAAGTLAAFSGVAIVPGRARAAQFEYNFAHNLPVSHSLHVRTVQMWKAVRERSGGRVIPVAKSKTWASLSRTPALRSARWSSLVASTY